MKITEESLKNQNTPPAPDPKAPQEDPRSEKDKLKSMSKKDRIWYIWAYYKFHIIAVIVVIGIIYSVASSFLHNNYDTALYCIYLNSRSDTEIDTAPLEQEFGEFLGLGKKDKIVTETSFVSFGDNASEFSYAEMAKITALVASKDLDIIIGDSETLEHYASLSGFTDLETLLPADLLDTVRPDLVYVSGEDGVKHAYGISLSGTRFAEASHLAQDPPLLGIISNSTRKDTAAALIDYIFAR